MKSIAKSVKKFLSDERGQGMTEYIIILVLVAIGVIAVVMAFGDKIEAMFTKATTDLDQVQ
ncbi:MAG: Flp family type IVb pilin [Deltaproteobacteria bacterium]|nr:Flp family type IVb pilin [Deltaproteobacteria bacterium]